MIAPLTADDVQSLRHCVEVALRRYHDNISELESDGTLPADRGESRRSDSFRQCVLAIFDHQIETAERLLRLLDDLAEPS